MRFGFYSSSFASLHQHKVTGGQGPEARRLQVTRRRCEGKIKRHRVSNPAMTAVPLTVIGVTYLTQGNWPQALAHFNRATEIAPENPLPHIGLGQARYAQQRLHEAASSFNAALALAERESSPHLHLGQTYFLEGFLAQRPAQLFGEARERLQITLRLSANHWEAQLSLAKLLFVTGEETACLTILEEMLQQPDKQPLQLLYLADEARGETYIRQAGRKISPQQAFAIRAAKHWTPEDLSEFIFGLKLRRTTGRFAQSRMFEPSPYQPRPIDKTEPGLFRLWCGRHVPDPKIVSFIIFSKD